MGYDLPDATSRIGVIVAQGGRFGGWANTSADLFSADEGADVGMDEDTPVTEDYQAGAPSRFILPRFQNFSGMNL